MVAAPVMFGRLHVLPIVAEFLASYPRIDVRLRLSDANVHLVDDGVDVAVRIGPLADSAMIATRVGAVRTVVCASPGLLRERGVPRAPADLARFPCVESDMPAPWPGWAFAEGGRPIQAPVTCRPRLLVTTADAAVEAARRDVGLVRLLHYQVAAAVADGALEIVLQDYELPPAPVHLVHVARGECLSSYAASSTTPRRSCASAWIGSAARGHERRPTLASASDAGGRSAAAELAFRLLEVAAFFQVGHEPAMDRHPAEPFAGERARGRGVQADEHGEKAEVLGRVFGCLVGHGQVQASTDDLGQLPDRSAFFAHGKVARVGHARLQRQPERPSASSRCTA